MCLLVPGCIVLQDLQTMKTGKKVSPPDFESAIWSIYNKYLNLFLRHSSFHIHSMGYLVPKTYKNIASKAKASKKGEGGWQNT